MPPPRGQLPHFFSGFRFCQPQIILALHIQPKLRIHAEPMAQPQSRIARNGTLALNDLANPIRRNLDLPGQCARSKANFGESIAENFEGGWGGA